MRSILLDELLPSEVEAIGVYLEDKCRLSGVDGLYWLSLPREMWNQNQINGLTGDGRETVQDYRLAVELGSDWVRFELLVRSDTLGNIGGGPADGRQVLFALNWAGRMAEKLSLSTCLPPVSPSS